MIDKSKQSAEKLRGGYYTPEIVAKYLWKWTSVCNPKNILDPSAGDGALVRIIDNPSTRIDSVELLEEESKKISYYNGNDKNNVYNDDFFNWINNNSDLKYDAIVSNPPYIRYQYLTKSQREIMSSILKKNGMKSNKLINAWVGFVVSSINLLNDQGRIGLVLPTDLLQVSYARQLRKFLMKNLEVMKIITFREGAFPGTQQDFLLLLGKKGKGSLSFKSLNLLNISELDRNPKFKDIKNFNINDKWSILKLDSNDRNYLLNSEYKSKKFSDLAKIEVGITTGSNKIFSLTTDDVLRIQARKYVKPLLGRSVNVNGIFFNKDVLKNDSINKQKVWLLDLNGYSFDELSTNTRKYLKTIEEKGENKGYKLRIRDEWFKIPGITIPDAFLLRRIGNVPKIILNKISAVSTDTFHRLTFKDDIDPNKVILAFYSTFALISMELNGRTYGGGALEILPGDLRNVEFPDIDYKKDETNINYEINKLHHLISNGSSIFDISEFVDSVLKNKFNYYVDNYRMSRILKNIRQLRIK